MSFTRQDAWAGGEYDLAIVLGAADDDRRTRALEALWSVPELDGCFLDRDREPADQPRVPPATEHDTLYGLARIAATSPALPCRSLAIRFDDGGDDWLWFGIPIASLARALPVGGFPFGRSGDPLAWRPALDAWFVDIAHRVFAAAPFQLALVGWTDASELDDADAFARHGVPAERWVGFLEPRDGALAWHPPNRGAPLC